MLLDLDLLRTFLAVVETGSMSAAAGRVLRTQAAVSQQMKRLEEQLGATLLDRSTRGLRSTEAGERLLGYARRLLDLSDEAAMAVRGGDAGGMVRLGIVQDLADSMLPAALARFARAHPAIRADVVVERSTRLAAMIDEGEVDMAIAARLDRPDAELVRTEPMIWLAAPGTPVERWRHDGIPLAVVDAPCPFRAAAIAALDRAGLPWRVAYQSPSLSGLIAALRAGLGVTARTALTAAGLEIVPGLPALPAAQFALYRRDAVPDAAAKRLESAIRGAFCEHP